MKQFIDIAVFFSILATGLSLKAVAHDSGLSLRIGSRRLDEPCDSVKDIICKMGNAKTFCDMVNDATDSYTAFGDGLEGGTIYTVFVPTDDAFKRVEDRLLDLSAEQLYRTLLIHFYEDVAMTFDDLECSTKLISLTGDTSRTKCRRITAGVYIKSQRGKGNKELNEYPVIETDSRQACTGIIHRIDHVMLPELFKPFEDLAPDQTINKPIIIDEDMKDEKKEKSEEKVIIEEESVEEEEESEEEIESIEEEKSVEEEKSIEKENNDVLTVAEKENGSISIIDWGTTVKPEETANLDHIDFDGDDKAAIGNDKYVVGTQIESTEIPPEVLEEMSVQAAEEVEKEEPERKGPRIGALGINLIIFSTLLLCFVFVCMRR